MYSSVLLFMNIGGPEMILIFLVVLLLFGGKKLPELARGLGKGLREFKDASDGIKREIHNNINAVNEEVNSATTSVNEALEDIDKVDTHANTGEADTPGENLSTGDGDPGELNTEETKIAH